ncbi:type VI secretion system protein TssL, short form [Serratia sp. JSRIV001]|uniref:type VI secretion system protein TssL, short form n=1 Tax=unclassified Serratia (in: enterobacteria) TaxID=2647522 RepID=UPI001CBD42D3|nr:MULTISPECIES: type VI secretion system protein TssL, short form [unclassified Serratia (in: enterobacteria)]UAN43949.1 type VI secretion system protein TssL, short form [Serratia sp. JSRIV001]UAN53539.1 type VI secretion system protein TssL, short form [Serratia sp. JSRIV002]UAN58160.1 type VI secretion system protein TssL, short form [Serratia sp. JSRIV004]
MSQSIKRPTPCVDIDALLEDTWLQVISLRQGIACEEGDGERFWQRCVDRIEHVHQTLTDAGVSAQNCQHIMYAQCAVLDETVKGRDVQDDAYFRWCDFPLQAHFFSTLNAGDQLYERMRTVLREAAPDSAVLTCFHRVLMLGFLGGYRSLAVTEREQLVEQLSARVPEFGFASSRPVLANATSRNHLDAWLRHWPVRVGLAGLAVVLLWWGLDHWLSGLLSTLLPGSAS